MKRVLNNSSLKIHWPIFFTKKTGVSGHFWRQTFYEKFKREVHLGDSWPYLCYSLRSWLHKIRIRNLSPGFDNNHTLKCCLGKLSNIILYIRVYGKMPGQHFKESLFSNQGTKVQILVECKGHICPIVSHLFRTLSPGL